MNITKSALALTTATAIALGSFAPVAAYAADAEPARVTAAAEELSSPITLSAGSASWNWVDSFRSYIGVSNETLTEGAGILEGAKDIEWQAVPGQTFDPENPGQLKFTGHARWYKYEGILDVHIANLTVDFAKKQLLVDASTAGTLSGGTAQSFTQQALLQMDDLKFEKRGDNLVISSHAPINTKLSDQVVGFYEGMKGAPFIASFKIDNGEDDLSYPKPIRWKLFPTMYADPNYTPPLTDPNEATFDVKVPDATLRACILDNLNLAEGTPIVNKVLQRVQSIQCIGINNDEETKIKDLTGLEYARNMTWLRVQYNNISDLTPLKNLSKLRQLDISHNKVSDLSPLSGIVGLQQLRATNNKLTSIEPLGGNYNLGVLDVSENRLTNLKGVPGSVTTLTAENNRISDVSALNGKKTPSIHNLNLRHNRISDITTLGELDQVERADLRNNFITNPCPVADWGSNWAYELLRLNLQENKFTDWTCLADTPRKDAPGEGEETQLNPLNLEDLIAADKAEESAEAEEANKVTAKNQTTTGSAEDVKKVGDAAAGAGFWFNNVPAGAVLSLGDTTPAEAGKFELSDDGVLTFTPAADFVGDATAVLKLTTLAGNVYEAKYTATVKAAATEDPAEPTTDKPAEPSDKPAEPTDKPAEPSDKPAEPSDKPAEPTDHKVTVKQGEDITFSAGPFDADEKVKLTVHSDPVDLGTVTADANGNVKYTWTVPADFEVGEHRAVFSGENGNTAEVHFTVTAADKAGIGSTIGALIAGGAIAGIIAGNSGSSGNTNANATANNANGKSAVAADKAGAAQGAGATQGAGANQQAGKAKTTLAATGVQNIIPIVALAFVLVLGATALLATRKR